MGVQRPGTLRLAQDVVVVNPEVDTSALSVGLPFDCSCTPRCIGTVNTRFIFLLSYAADAELMCWTRNRTGADPSPW
jgi:hypothetical protein